MAEPVSALFAPHVNLVQLLPFVLSVRASVLCLCVCAVIVLPTKGTVTHDGGGGVAIALGAIATAST